MICNWVSIGVLQGLCFRAGKPGPNLSESLGAEVEASRVQDSRVEAVGLVDSGF